MKRFFAKITVLFISMTTVFADDQEASHLSGKLVKKYYSAPRIVKNPAFGWYLELSQPSQDIILKKFQQLPKDDQRLFKDLDLDIFIVQCVDCTDEFLLQARLFEGAPILINGELEIPYLARNYLCFTIKPNMIQKLVFEKANALVVCKQSSCCFGCVKTPGLNDRKFSCIKLIQRYLRSFNRGDFHISPNTKNFIYRLQDLPLTNPNSEEIPTWSKADSSGSFGIDTFDHLSKYFYTDNSLSDTSEAEPLLQLPENTPEKLVILKGKPILRLFPGPPEYTSIERGDRADYCWMLELNEESFKLATSTLVGEPCSDLKSILSWSNHNELMLGLNENVNDFCCDHEGKEITVHGILFHAHTAHHYAPLLMDVKKLSDEQSVNIPK